MSSVTPMRDPSIPDEAWNKFWKIADEGKRTLIKSINECLNNQEEFSFKYIYPSLIKTLNFPNTFNQLCSFVSMEVV